jgi:hypothetical protein
MESLPTKDGLAHARRIPIANLRSHSSREAANEIYRKSLVYQEVDGARKLVAANYVLRSKDRVGTQKPLTAIEI